MFSIYAISEDLDSKYVFADLGLAQELLEYKSNQISELRSKETKLMKLQS
jgi:lipoprotein-releasing system permease protein